MIPITEVVKGIFKIGPLDTKRPTPWTSPYLVVGKERAAIVEPGEGGQAPQLLEAIGGSEEGAIGMDLNRIAYLIPTHIHLHHVHGVNVLLREIPRAKVVVHQRGAPHLVEPTQLNASTLQVWGKESGCPQLSPVPQDRIMSVAGGEVIDLGGRELEIIEALGHAPHHNCIFDRLTRTLFTGDAVGGFFAGPGHERSRPEIVPPLFDVDKQKDTLRRLRALKPSVLLVFGHNALSHSPDKTLQWALEDVTAVEGIVREGMRQKMSGKEIGRKVLQYYDQVGVAYPGGEEGGRSEGTVPIGLMRYLRKQDPSLEMPH